MQFYWIILFWSGSKIKQNFLLKFPLVSQRTFNEGFAIWLKMFMK